MIVDDIVTFEEFLRNNKIPSDDPRLPILKETWNQAILTAACHASMAEGTSSEIETLKVR